MAEEETTTAGELVRLSELEYEQEPGQPELLGWPVADADGKTIGRVDDLLVDTETGEIPFAAVCYDDKCTAVPLELMFLDEPNRRLVLPAHKADLENAPQLTDETEDVQPHAQYWDGLVGAWQAELAKEGGERTEEQGARAEE